jgi:hypothetical protein
MRNAAAGMVMLVLSLAAGGQGPAEKKDPRPHGVPYVAPHEEHGKSDAFAVPGVALAWGVLRGADEGSTTVVIRIVTDPGMYRVVSVVGSDPFTREQRTVQPPTPSSGAIDLRIPRTHFADFPRTELRFHENANAAPKLAVFYLGVPDTVPEFDSPEKLGADLDRRLARVRAMEKPRSP